MTEKEFITAWKLQLESENTKHFPDDFISSENLKELGLPSTTFVMGQEFFGAFEILTVDGNPIYQANSHSEAKYILYSNRDKPGKISIPSKEADIKTANSNYESYLDSIIKDIEKDYRKNFPGQKNMNLVTNEIFRLLNLTRY